LHDGAQQRLVHTVITLKLAQRALQNGDSTAGALVSEALEHAQQTNTELRELAHGTLPAVLRHGGLGPALRTLARRSNVPVALDVRSERRLTEGVEAAAYYVVSEALTNVAKHAQASLVHVDLEAEDSSLHLSIRDDGVGGAAPAQGSGLVGLRDRLEAVGGTIDIVSPAGNGTSLLVEIPCRPSPPDTPRSSPASDPTRG
jgi:signal transduction histidine kinase